MPDYNRMTKAELIARLRTLESAAGSGDQPPATAAKRRQGPVDPGRSDSEERLRAILETAVEAIITIDERGIIESLNPAAEKAFGYRAVELVGRNVSMLMPPPYREEHDAYLARYLDTGEARIIGIGRETVARRKDGTVFPIDLSVSEVRLAERRMFTGFIRDITERKQAEAQLASLAHTLTEKNKELETIVYVASHDLRSPLVNIQGFSRELAQACDRLLALAGQGRGSNDLSPEARRLLAEEIPEAIQYILAGTAKIDVLLSGLLRYSRLGRTVLNLERLDMNAMLAGIVRSMEFQIQQARAVLRLGPLPECLGDATQINQVFSNLIDNAVKYLDPDRPGEISVTGTLKQARAVYRVQDNGIGIAPDHQAKIFEIFHRLNPHRGEGEGLGLTIAQKIVERHNGSLSIESAPGRGSAFLVSLPAPAGTK